MEFKLAFAELNGDVSSRVGGEESLQFFSCVGESDFDFIVLHGVLSNQIIYTLNFITLDYEHCEKMSGFRKFI